MPVSRDQGIAYEPVAPPPLRHRFREQAAARLTEPGAARASVARELGVAPSQLSGWQMERAAEGSAGSDPSPAGRGIGACGPRWS
ncbi:transposase [Poseidonocella sp. HB161398]|uniref:transposase n=1 Tax=Poseidonocella sp. HB161398 TaxID=2320855 RepID=UPI001486E0B9